MKAIVVIDMTNDFVKDKYWWPEDFKYPKEYKGKLVAPLGKTIIDPIGTLIDKGVKYEVPIIYLQDEHDENSEEIKSKTWPEHCMKGTPGAETIWELRPHARHRHALRKHIFRVTKDTYNGFVNPELNKLLKEKGISEQYLTGLVQEVCIKENALGALENNYKVNVVVDATVPFKPLAGYNALKELEQRGARLINLETALEEIQNGN